MFEQIQPFFGNFEMDLSPVVAASNPFDQIVFFESVYDPRDGTVVEKDKLGEITKGDGPVTAYLPKADDLGKGNAIIFMNMF